MDIGHGHDDLSGCTDAEAGEGGLCAAGLDGDTETGLNPCCGNDGGETVCVRVLDDARTIGDGGGQDGGAGEGEIERIAVKAQNSGHGGGGGSRGIDDVGFDECLAVAHENEVGIGGFLNVSLTEIDGINGSGCRGEVTNRIGKSN